MVATRSGAETSPLRERVLDKSTVKKTDDVAHFSSDEVNKHDRPDNCWVVVHGKVYDVTSWVPKHPGGGLIYVNAGGDCSQLFDSYHPERARRVLEKFYIGEVDVPQGKENDFIKYVDKRNQSEFYKTVKSRVEKYFRDSKLDSRFSTSLYIKAALILATTGASFYGAFFAFDQYLASALCAVVLGVCFAEVGVSIQHDANHGAFSRNRFVCYLLGTTLDSLGGASSFMWKQQHVIGHHALTNVNNGDPDIRVEDPDVRRVTPHQPWQSYQAYQHIYLGFLYGLLAIKSILIDDFKAISAGRIGPVRLTRMTLGETVVFWGGKLVFASWFVLLPAFYSHHGWLALASLWILSEAVTGWMLAFLFQVAHVTPDVEYFEASNGLVERDWAAAQMATTADFCHGSWFWTHISGGLNYQVVHHLFPGVAHTHYPALSPIVAATAKEFGLPYIVYPTFWTALGSHFRHLKAVGNPGKMYSLATVG